MSAADDNLVEVVHGFPEDGHGDGDGLALDGFVDAHRRNAHQVRFVLRPAAPPAAPLTEDDRAQMIATAVGAGVRRLHAEATEKGVGIAWETLVVCPAWGEQDVMLAHATTYPTESGS